MKSRPNPNRLPLLSFGLYLGFPLLAFAPCLFFGQAYFDNDLLAQFGPWRTFLKDQLSQGHFPLWNPYLLGGQPFLADLQNMMFYPVNYLTLLFPVAYGLSVFFFLHMVLAAFGMDLWLGSLGLSTPSRRVGALLFALSGFYWLEIIHPPVIAAFAWLPWLFYGVELLAKDLKPRNALGVGLIFALLFVAGSFQVTLGAFYAGLGYGLTRLFQRGAKTSLPTFQTFLPLAFFLLWGAFPLLAQLIPTWEYARLTDRGAATQNFEDTSLGLSLTPAKLYQFIFPRISLPADRTMAEAVQMDSRDSSAPFAGDWGYLGIWAPFFLALSLGRRDKKIVPLLTIGLLALLICLGPLMPFYHLLWKWLPGFSIIRVPYRYLFLYVLAVCPLVAMGWEDWMAQDQKDLSWKSWWVPGAYALVLAIIGFSRPAMDWRELNALALGLAALTLPGLAGSKTKTLATLLWAMALVAPLLLSGWDDFRPGPSSNFDYAANSGGLLEARQTLGPNRVVYFNTEMHYPIRVDGQWYTLAYPQNASCALGLKNANGYNPLVLQVKRDLSYLPIITLLRLQAIQGVLTQKIHENMEGFKPQVFRSFLFYEFKDPIRYVFAPEKRILIADKAQRLERMRQKDYDPYRETLLTGPLPVEVAATLSDKPAKLNYQFIKDGADEQAFAVETTQNSLVVFSEILYPGWKAWLDGKPTALYPADHLLRSLVVPAGNHEVVFRFEPPWKGPILWGLLAWTLLTLAGYWMGRKSLFA